MPEPLNDRTSYELDGLDSEIQPLADVAEPEPVDIVATEEFNEPKSEAFMKARKIIEDGIAKSTKGGYRVLKVEFFVEDKTQPRGERLVTMSLAQFLGGNSLHKIVSNEDHAELFAQYGEKASQFSEERTQKGLGDAALSDSRPTYRSGAREYKDFQSAAAGDDTLED